MPAFAHVPTATGLERTLSRAASPGLWPGETMFRRRFSLWAYVIGPLAQAVP
ncbi:hypothetical protein [Komagataeibacter europaeus]|uniref:hypothetical protein n=1 Tax=Komagataeibacter europaeus TaxID=33995 RepID=UPI00031359E1|nr:hypothetical protein [Komagataeibacter europaeus]